MRHWLAGLLGGGVLAGLLGGCAEKKPAAPPPPIIDVAPAAYLNTAFALDLYARLRTREGNIFFSPHSVSTALVLTAAGARGETADEMAQVLRLPAYFDVHATYAALLRSLDRIDPKTGCELANATVLWAQAGRPVFPEFRDLAVRHYRAGVEEVDFAGDPGAARRVINAWGREQTRGRVAELLPPGLPGADTRLVLTNAVYFKGAWARQFPKGQTRDGDFHLGPGRKVAVPMMRHGEGEYHYFKTDSFKALELPYAGDRLALVVLLPREIDGLAALERRLTADQLPGWMTQLLPARLFWVKLPRFRVNNSFALGPVLAGLGMEQAFSPQADFSGIADGPGLGLQEVVHQAAVEVHEEGTEAAAGAGVAVGGAGFDLPIFEADRPFVFLIRDRISGSILFLGRVVDPRS